MVKVVIIYHSGFGHTTKLAKCVCSGVNSVAGVDAEMLTTEEAIKDIATLKEYDGMIFGSPTYMGSVSAPFKEFMDVSSQQWFEQEWQDKLAGGFTNSASMSGDKFNSLVQLVTFAAQHSMLWVPLKVANETSALDITSGDPSKLNRVGSNLGVAAQSENASPEETPLSGDLRTAEIYGKDFAEAVLRWNK